MSVKKVIAVLLIIPIIALVGRAVSAHETLRLNISHNTVVELVFERVVAEAFRRLKVPYIRADLPERRAILRVDRGEDDGIGPRNKAVERKFKNIVRVPETINTHTYVAFGKDPTVSTPNWDNFSSLHIAYVASWKIFDNNVEKPGSVMKVQTPDQLFDVLEHDRVDLVLYSRLSGLSVIKKKKLKGIHILDPPLAHREVYLYLHKHHADLVEPIAEKVREMKADGSYQRIKDQAIKEFMSALD